MKTVLTVAGSDPSGGAGIQADLKTMTALGTYGMSAITAVTAQNTCGVRAVQTIAPALLRAQMEAVFEDIPPDAVKIGMIASAEQVQVIADCLRRYHARHIVLDPVMLATSGAELAGAETVAAMQQHLFPMAEIRRTSRRHGYSAARTSHPMPIWSRQRRACTGDTAAPSCSKADTAHMPMMCSAIRAAYGGTAVNASPIPIPTVRAVPCQVPWLSGWQRKHRRKRRCIMRKNI